MTFLPRAGGMRRGRFGHCPLSQGSLASHSPHPLGHRGPDPGRGAPGGLSEEDVPLRAWRGGETGRALGLKSQLA